MATNETYITIEDANAEFRRYKFPLASRQELSFNTSNKPVLLTRKLVSFEGVAVAGSISVPGLAVGDVVRGLVGLTIGDLGDQSANFEAIITVVDEIQQTGAGLNGKVFAGEIATETVGLQM